MKSKDLQKVVLSKYQKGDTPTQIYHDLNGTLGLSTIKRWCQMICRTGSIDLSKSSGAPRLIRTKENIQKVKNRLRRKKEYQLLDYQWSLVSLRLAFGEY